MLGTTRSFFRICGILFFVKTSLAQTTMEVFSSDDTLILEAWWFKTLEVNPKFNFFSINEAIHNYDLETTQYMSYTIAGYEIAKGFGPVLGARFLQNRASGLAGVQYAKYSPVFFITTNFTSEIRNNPFFEWYMLLQYRPKFNEKLKLFTQFQNAINFSSEGHDFSFQRLRIGLDFGFLQGGLAINTTQLGKDWVFDTEPGVFLRMELQ